jgi:hypothetical protein
VAEEGRLRREGRAIFYRLHDEDADYPGEEVLLARIPDYLTPEEWERLYARARSDRG